MAVRFPEQDAVNQEERLVFTIMKGNPEGTMCSLLS